ncbi:MAG: hypothetical protein QE263_04780 [Vampirovibrionales bacterium]|nr:hypothetical protein [Vampirovibrionales bacterium]
MSQPTHHRLCRLTPRAWQALLSQPTAAPALSYSGIRQGYPLSPAPMGWAIVLNGQQDSSPPLAAVWVVVERPHQWRLIWSTQPGEASANEALLAHLAAQAQRHGISHFSCAIEMNGTVLAGLLKSHGFRHVATQTHWHTVLEQRASHSQKKDADGVLPSLRLARYNDAWPLFHLAQEACPVHARPYLMPWPPSWKRDGWGACRRFMLGEYQRQWVLERPSKSSTSCHTLAPPVFIGHAKVCSQQYPSFQVQLTLNEGWEEITSDLVHFVLAHTLQQAHQPSIGWQTFSHQQALEDELTRRRFEVVSRELILVRDVWTSIAPEKPSGLGELFLPADPLYGSAQGKPC